MILQRVLQTTAYFGLVALLVVGCGTVQDQPAATRTPFPPESTAAGESTPPTPTPVPPAPTSESTPADTSYYHFRLGEFECACLYDGSHNYPLKDIFPGVPQEEVQTLLRQHGQSIYYARAPYTSLYVNTGEHQVLVDMGAGRTLVDTGKLPQSMRAAGIDPAQIDTVIITHAHPDHIGGALDKSGKPIYANANYFISEVEWDFWFSEEAMAQTLPMFVRTARRSLDPIRDRMNLVQGESEVVPGIRVIPAPGHTPGHVVVLVSSGDEQLVYASDAATHPFHLEYYPDLVGIYDILPEERVATRHQIYDWAAAEELLVIGQQFSPFPSLGTVSKLDRGWRWQPVEPAAMPAAVAQAPVPSKELDGRRALLVIYDRFQEREYAVPRTILEDEGVIVTVASSSLKLLTGTGGAKIHPDLLLGDLVASDYDAVVFVGGQGYETNNPEAQRLAREAVARDKVVAAICIAPITLARAGVLEGKRVTGALKPVHLEQVGAIFTGALVESDGQVITASGPAGSREFGEAIAAALRQ